MSEGTPIGALAVRIGADATDLVREFSKAGKETDKLGARFRAALTSAAELAAGLGAAGLAVGALVKSVADSADQLGKMAQKVGVSVEALSGLKYAAQLSDVSLDQLGQGLKQLSKFMAENGIQGVSIEEQLLRIADEFAGSATESNRAAVAMKYFGKSGADMIPLLNQGRDGIAEMRHEAERLGVVIGKDAAEAAEKFNDNLTRLKAASEGLAIRVAGPLVQAFGEATQAMIEAHKEGESFLTMLARGWQMLATGNDSQKWAKNFTEATDQYVAALDKMDSVRKGRKVEQLSASERAIFERARQEAAKLKAELDTMRAIQPIIAPEVAEKSKPTGTLTMPGDPGQAQKDAELIGRQYQEQLDEQIRVRGEQAQIMSDYRAVELERERAFVDERNRVLIEAWNREEAEAIAHGAETMAIDEAIAENERQLQRQRLAGTQDFLSNLAGLMNTNSRKTFEAGKAAALAQAGVKGALAVMEAWEAGMSTGGPWAPAVAALYAGAAAANALNLMNNIRQQTFGAGGGAPTPPGQGSSGIGSVPVEQSGGNRNRGPDNIVHLHGEGPVSMKQLRAFIKQLEESTRDGGRIVLA